MKRKIVLLVIALLFIFSSCAPRTVKYNINVLYQNHTLNTERGSGWDYFVNFQEGFIENNRIDTEYKNPDYIEGVSPREDKYLYFPGEPKERIFVVRNEEEFSEIFTHEATGVDFEKDVLIVYMHIGDYVDDVYVTKVNVVDNTLEIEFDYTDPLASCGYCITVEAGCPPHLRVDVFMLDNIEFDDVVITEKA